MTQSDQSPGGPALIVFGIFPGESTPRAGWFPAEQVARARNSARVLGLVTLAVESDAVLTVAHSLEKGALTTSGRPELSPVSPDTVAQLLDHHRAAHTTDISRGPEMDQGLPSLASRPRSPIPKSLWDLLTLTDVVLAANLEDGEPAGWWEAVILNVRYGTYTLRWCDYPEEGLFRRQRKHIALLFPD